MIHGKIPHLETKFLFIATHLLLRSDWHSPNLSITTTNWVLLSLWQIFNRFCLYKSQSYKLRRRNCSKHSKILLKFNKGFLRVFLEFLVNFSRVFSSYITLSKLGWNLMKTIFVVIFIYFSYSISNLCFRFFNFILLDIPCSLSKSNSSYY